ncbi:precorrin-6A synthase (deacetylating) [Ancylobacter dichloromethanicus]|uniref:Precorrin-6A synthase [deacetylating] n=1 Tax=Ancylobacter dichloromethanicus TaxID=518825 RepID=A0A9W6J994_9HYPH|nr:precorrin-6A synthase (deacetylating) [Ancylobacter dichloromethanicus]MBS7554867.1 precorrin-6A synthase (deacetylating) [Ancylobacter dichloromethanicus]GLK73261.1 precorrin-6A synthase (deacetylating) [Ancylobacter dichloromethanicus]
MRRLLVIGIGMGEPEGLTARAADALGRANTFFLLDKSEAAGELVSARQALIARFGRPGHRVVRAPSPPRRPAPLAGARKAYEGAVVDWHGARAALLAGLIARELGEDETGAMLVWGDPMLYDSTLRVLAAARAGADFIVEVFPGVTALQALCAAHAVPLNGIGEEVRLTTGRHVAQATPDAPAFAVLLDDGSGLEALLARGFEGTLWWGANLGTEAEILVAGRLCEVGAAALAARAQVKAARGWVMDVWLARRASPEAISAP